MSTNEQLAGLLKEARNIIRSSNHRNLAKDWDGRATKALAAYRATPPQAEAAQPAGEPPTMADVVDALNCFNPGDEPWTEADFIAVTALPKFLHSVGQAWYTSPPQVQRAGLSEAQIEDCIDSANRKFNGRRQGPSGQQLTTYDDWKHWLAREVEAELRKLWGISPVGDSHE